MKSIEGRKANASRLEKEDKYLALAPSDTDPATASR
jgi:hypothetical protein